ncbi:MAG: DUF3800 domain-containing protein [Magnetococcales bacterium]|nr:DUF3800 domain-containing protein [Magnetococcales bacterium]
MEPHSAIGKKPCPACWGTGRRCAKSECCGAEPDHSPCPECYGTGWLEVSCSRSILNFYMDESGSRNPERLNSLPRHGHDWFALGGILIEDVDEPLARKQYQEFCKKWEIQHPLHSAEIRGKCNKFAWIGKLKKNEQDDFFVSLTELLTNMPVIGIACVIDRPGYNDRYEALYAGQRWQMCKTAFSISVERAAKYAEKKKLKLRVLPEECNKHDDKILKGYYDSILESGLPFNQSSSEKYKPLIREDFKDILREFRIKKKSSPMMQIADLYLWPMCIGGYDPTNRPYESLRKAGKLMDCLLPGEETDRLGIKYGCFESTRGTIKQQPE